MQAWTYLTRPRTSVWWAVQALRSAPGTAALGLDPFGLVMAKTFTGAGTGSVGNT